MVEKIIFTMGEVAEMFDVRPSLLRHWESQFPVLRPRRNKKGNRLFTQQDLENLRLIYHLVKERGMTLEGAKKAMRAYKSSPTMNRDAELAERLQRIRALLVEVREELKMGDDEVIVDDEPQDEIIAKPVTAPVPEPVAVQPDPEVVDEPEEVQPVAVTEPEHEDVVPETEEDPESQTTPETALAEPVQRRQRRRRKKEEGEEKELFAFYEQSLF